jgi:hypothetical protein
MTLQADWRYCQKCHQMFFDGYPDKGRCSAGDGHQAAGFNFGLPYDVPASGNAQDAWRFCERCSVMYYDGFPNKGRCPDGGHQAAGFNFVLPHDIPPTANMQADWRYCNKCHAMFFDGFPDKGHCSAGAGHEAAGFNFVLPHDVPGNDNSQAAWRYCGKCHVMFFDGFPTKGICPAGGNHEAIGYGFVLPHDVEQNDHAQGAWRFCERCNVMFFDGFPDKGHCPAGGHQAAGFNFILPHDVPETNVAQGAWRFCEKCNGMFFDGFPDKGYCPSGGGHQAAGFVFVLPHDLQDTASAQANWRFCQKCNAMFFDGFPDKGFCPSGGTHDAAGFHFVLPHSMPDAPNRQTDWRFCQKCKVMFFDGFPEKGRCAAGGPHDAAGLNFSVHHDLPENSHAQSNWRFCNKCNTLFYDGLPPKGTCPAGGGHTSQGFNFVLPRDLREPFIFSANIETGGLAALGGFVSLIVNLDGSVHWSGHAHDSGADGYEFSIGGLVRTATGKAVAVSHSGHVGGTFTPGSRDHDWDDPYPNSVAPYLLEFCFGQLDTHLEYTSDIGSAAQSLLDWAIKFGVGTALGPVVGVVVFCGVEAGSLLSTGSLVPGARVLEGVLWMAGPSNTLFAIVAAGIAAVGSRSRDISQEEYDWANQEVFAGSLPPRDTLVLTDTIGPGSPPRAFTFPRFDGKITLNLGPDAYDDPRKYPTKPYGNTFVHELVHACQIHYRKMELTLLADALSAKLCEATGGDPYLYPQAGANYTDLGLEQQAQIVSDWYSGLIPAGTNQTGIPKDENSPYFRYITDNVRLHVV